MVARVRAAVKARRRAKPHRVRWMTFVTIGSFGTPSLEMTALFRKLSPVAATLLITACAGEPTDALDPTMSLYALVEGIDGFHFYPPLGPEPTTQGAFDATLADGLSVVLEAVDAQGAVRVAGRFDATTSPAIALLGTHERYYVGVPAAQFVTNPAETYRFVVSLDGAELGQSTLSARVFDVLARYPALTIGVHVRVEGQAVRTAAPVQ